MSSQKFDVIIVGSGMGGLACGYMLSKEGLNVCVLEKNHQIGGCLQTFTRKGAVLDTGIHYVGSLEEGQVLHQYFKYFDLIGKVKLRKMDNVFDVINIEGREFHHSMGHENYIERLSAEFPGEEENIRKVIYKMKEIGDLIKVDSLHKGIFSENPMEYFSISAHQFLANATSNKTLQNALAATTILCGGIKEVSSFYILAMICNSYIESAYRFVDGSSQISDLLCESIEKNGGQILANQEVTRFIVENDQLVAVEVNGSERIEAKSFISSMHPARTLELLDKNKVIKKAYHSRIQGLQNTTGYFTVSLVFKKNMFKYLNQNFYYHFTNDVWMPTEKTSNNIERLLFCTAASSSSTEYAEVAHIITPMYWSEIEQWENTTVEQRGNAYKQFKQQKAEELIDKMTQYFPNLKSSIESYYTSTPLTYRDYTATPQGSAYGIIKDFNNPMATFLSPRTRLPNLFYTGQNVNVHGMLGVVLTAAYTCAQYLGMDYLAKKIGNA